MENLLRVSARGRRFVLLCHDWGFGVSAGGVALPAYIQLMYSYFFLFLWYSFLICDTPYILAFILDNCVFVLSRKDVDVGDVVECVVLIQCCSGLKRRYSRNMYRSLEYSTHICLHVPNLKLTLSIYRTS